MKVKSAGLVGLAALLIGLFGAQPQRQQVARAPHVALKSAPLLALVWKRNTARLARVAPDSLRVARGRSLALGRGSFAWGLSPKGTRVAVAGQQSGSIRIVDTRAMRVRGQIAGRWSEISDLVWVSATRIIAVRPQYAHVLTIDVPSRKVVKIGSLEGQVEATVRSADGVLLLLSPENEIGPTTLLAARADGSSRAVTLDRIWSGWHWPEEATQDPVGTVRQAGIAVDSAANRAYVVAPGSTVAEIDLSTLAVVYHELSQPVSFFGRLHDWIEPSAEAKGQNGPVREARWLGGGLIAVTGTDNTASAADGSEVFSSTPAGLKLIDTRDWSIRTVDRGATGVTAANDRLVAFGSSFDSRAESESGMGIAAYTMAGSLLYRALGNAPLYRVHAAEGRYYVWGNRMTWIVDQNDGRVLTQFKQSSRPWVELVLAES